MGQQRCHHEQHPATGDEAKGGDGLGDYERWAAVVLMGYYDSLRDLLAEACRLQAEGDGFQKSWGAALARRLGAGHLAVPCGGALVDWDEVMRALKAAGLPRRRALLPLGRHDVTQAALEDLTPLDVCVAALRHGRGVWGELDEDFREANERGLREGERLVSAHRARDGTQFFVVTDPDRAVTSVIVPAELGD
ncbi:hypothetical protein [Tautonia sociabilis]|uniref:hypothetical protein n=1 Tax=Tautonia sociabilis TaxID=2080755 RepID=UPI00131580A6|nr:hypothetical protein [Tautonia sociabilis]